MEIVNGFDIGANLTHNSFRDDLEQVIERASKVLDHIVVTCCSADDLNRVISICESFNNKYPNFLYATAGTHPHWSKDFKGSDIDLFRKFASSSSIVAWGEMGLDNHRHISSPKEQEIAFERQLELACEIKKPLFLHERDAHTRFLQILKFYRNSLDNIVVHCFTGNKEELFNYLDLDAYIGITGWIGDKNRGGHLHELLSSIPQDKLMIETDAPYLFPCSLSKNILADSNRNEPFILPFVADIISQSLGKSRDKILSQTRENACRFFGI